MATSTPLTRDDLICVLTTALECFRREVDPEIPAAKILTLLTVAKHSGLQQLDLPNHVSALSPSAASRHVMDWTEVDKNRRPGPAFVDPRPDPMFRRRNLLFITPKGQHFLDRVASSVNSKLAKGARA